MAAPLLYAEPILTFCFIEKSTQHARLYEDNAAQSFQKR